MSNNPEHSSETLQESTSMSENPKQSTSTSGNPEHEIGRNPEHEILLVTVKEHRDNRDLEGQLIYTGLICPQTNFRRYTVNVDKLIRVTVQNMNCIPVALTVVYVSSTNVKEPENPVVLVAGDSYELPFPLQKDAEEKEDGWDIIDDNGNTIIKLGFAL